MAILCFACRPPPKEALEDGTLFRLVGCYQESVLPRVWNHVDWWLSVYVKVSSLALPRSFMLSYLLAIYSLLFYVSVLQGAHELFCLSTIKMGLLMLVNCSHHQGPQDRSFI